MPTLWTAPRTWVAGEIITADIGNAHWRDNLLYLKGTGEATVLGNALTLGAYALTINALETVGADGIVNKEQVEDHTHADAANCGQIDHGTGCVAASLLDDDHTQYQKESLLTTAGDIPYATGDSTWARLGIGTVGQVLRTNAGATAPEWAASVATKQFYVPCFNGLNGVLTSGFGAYSLNSAADAAYISFRLPDDFASLTSVKVIIIPITTGTFDWTATTTFGANGEAYNIHSDSTTADTQAATNLQLLELDISAAYTGIAANDIINTTFTLDALATTTELIIIGLDIKYT